MAENKLRMVVSWNPDIFTDDAQYSLLIELANWIQSEIYSRPQRTANSKLSEVGRCLLMHVCTMLVWGIFGNMDKELLLHEEKKRLLRANVSFIVCFWCALVCFMLLTKHRYL